MFRFVNSYVSVKSYAINDDLELLFNSEHEVRRAGSVVFESVVKLQEIYYKNPFFYINDFDGNGFCIDKYFDVHRSELVKGVVNSESILIKSKNQTVLYNVFYHSYLQVLDFNVFKFFLTGEIIFSFKKSHVCKNNVFSGKLLWEEEIQKPVILNEKITGNKFFGVWQNELLISSKNNVITSFNIETGAIIRHWYEIPGFIFDAEIRGVIPRSESFVLDGDKLIGALFLYYFEIDLVSG